MDIRNLAFDIYRKALDSAGAANTSDAFSGDVPPQEAAFVKRLVQTALRRQEFIKKIIAGYAAKKIPARPDAVHAALILGAVEILYFNTPDYAAVDSYVNLAKKKNRHAGGFVNAVLRKICRDKKELAARPPLPFFPPSFREMLRGSWSKKQIAEIEKAAAEEPALDITVRKNPEYWCQKLGGRLLGSGTVRLEHTGSVAALPSFSEGAWWVQDFSSALPVISLGCIENQNALDLCAAPGGKTAQLLAAKARVTALDISPDRLKKLKENLFRLHLKAEKTVAADAFDYLQSCPRFDIVLLDAPCSADGTLRRHPELVHTRTMADVRRSADIQSRLLAAAATAVKPDGILLYAVCSMCREEGEDQIKNFLANHPDFSLCPVSAKEINPFNQEGFERLVSPEGFIRCLPDMLGGIDGFFAAKLRKRPT